MTIRSKKGLINYYYSAEPNVQTFFEHLPSLIEAYPLEVALSYVFLRLELAQNLAIYCGIVKQHRADADLAWAAVNNQHMTREGFQEMFKVVFGKAVPRGSSARLKAAEGVRDKVVHGKAVTDADKRNAIANVLDYAAAFSARVNEIARFDPVGSLRGFKGRRSALDKATTRWILKGMGFHAS